MSLIHRYQSNGYNIVLDINSGCIHLVDLVTYEVLPFMEEGLSEQEIVDKLKDQYPEADIRTSVSECEKLKEQGMLFTRDIYENIIDEFTENRQTVVKALCLHIAHDCNLACRYCFAEEGEYHGRRALMSFEVGKKALDFLIANSGSRKNLEVDFFGGEPLMNWQVVKDLVAYGREDVYKRQVRHVVKDYQKKLKRRQKEETLFCELPEIVVENLAVWDDYDTDYTIFNVCGNDIRVYDDELAEALKQLSERNRETLLMYYFLEMNNEEIAKKQNISRSGVFQNRHNSLALMKKLLKEKQ